MRTFIKFVFGLGLLVPLLTLAKGDGVDFTMEGTLTNFSLSGTNCHFTFTGTFQITQWHHNSSTTIEMDCKHGFPATVSQNGFFVATHPTANAAAVRNNPDALSKILELAAARGRVIKFELINPKITYGNAGNITELQSAVVRATDWDLH
jgi:hypothetical protein